MSEHLASDPVQAAKSAGLRYVSDAMAGIRRIGTKKAFRYLDAKGHVVRDTETLRRIQRLAIPPAWTNVWICPSAEGHLQAVGRDARKRKQYRYHPQWRETRDGTKYHRMAAFGKALPRIRRKIERDLKEKQLTRNKVLAIIVRLLEMTLIRIGNEEYRKQNDSFGLTTLRDRHVHIKGPQVEFYFRGKSGVKQTISLENAYLAKLVRRLRDLPGYELFQYYDENKELRAVDSADVNQYMRDAAGDDFTAKDFRTWAGTMLAAAALSNCTFSTATQAQKNVKTAIATVADRLGNTVAVCKKCYIHPAIIETYLDGSLGAKLTPANGRGRLSAQEASVLHFLRKHTRPKRTVSLERSLTQSIRHVRKAG